MFNIQSINCGDTFEYLFNYTDHVHSDFMDFSVDNSKIHTNLEFVKPNGLGIMTFPDGRKYVGEWKKC
jgi:hypothetical protein